jgi:hypothetical protein
LFTSFDPYSPAVVETRQMLASLIVRGSIHDDIALAGRLAP